MDSEKQDRGDTVSTTESLSTETAAAGVHTVEASHQVYGRFSKVFLFLSLGLACYIYSLDGTTTWNYQAFAVSTFGAANFLGTLQVTQSTIIAVGKPVIAKIADIGSRGAAYCIVLLFYVLGYIVIASANSSSVIIGGTVLYAIGYTGLQLLTQVIIADNTTLKWRGLTTGLTSAPFIVNAFISPNIATNVLNGAGWRWGYGMFAILMPVSLAPLIIVLLWAERKTAKLNRVSTPATPTKPLLNRLVGAIHKLDLIGLVLLGASVALILLPLTLTDSGVKRLMKAKSHIAMLTVGCVLFPLYLLWDIKFAKYPIIPRRFITNRTFVIAATVNALDFVSFYISFTYLYSFVIVVKPWPLLHASYFTSTQTIALSIFAIVAGTAMRFVHKSKPVLIVGLAIRLLGAGLMIHSRGANASDAEVVWSQILQGMGGGFASVSSQVSAQASVSHVDVAMVTAVLLLITEIGGAIGGAIAGAIWTNSMPAELAKYIPQLSEDERTTLFGSIVSAAANPRGDPIREGVILAYDAVMKKMTIAAAVVAVVPFVLSFWLPDWYLGDQQNAVDNVDLAGQRIDTKETKEKA